jgi:hypothetical protein
MTSSTTPPASVQHSVYCACPGAILPRSAVNTPFTELGRAGTRDGERAEVADVEHAHVLAHRGVLGQGAAG